MANDQGFAGKPFNARLVTLSSPGDDVDDSTKYIVTPGVVFMRPWLASGPLAFQWPLGLEGFSMAVDPTLGLHKYIGDNKVVAEVLHAGEEHFTMNGNFPGFSAPDNIKALRRVVYADAPDTGKLLWLPEIYDFVMRVQVVRFEASRQPEDRGYDSAYNIEFVRMGDTNVQIDPDPAPPVNPGQGSSPAARTVRVDAVHNTLRKIAQWKLGSADKWRAVYNLNVKFFTKRGIQISKAPTYALPIGTVIYY